MVEPKKFKKSGRTPEQQAARDARKATKLAQGSKPLPGSVEAESPAESSAMALAAQPETQPAGTKRRRNSEAEEDAEDLLEIDVDAPEPLSKAEVRAARKRAKKNLETASKPKAEKSGQGSDVHDGLDAAEDEGKAKKVYVKKQNSIWIGNLSFKTTEASLKAFLEKGVTDLGGESEGSVTRVNLPKKNGKGQYAENKG